MRKRKTPLVVQHLENIPRAALGRFPEFIREFARRRNGVYALYKGTRLYYVGLAGNLRGRLHGHLGDRHAQAWDRFSIYLTEGDEHLRELEALVLRIASPQGNRVFGKLVGSDDLKGTFRKHIRDLQKREFAELAGGLEPMARRTDKHSPKAARKNMRLPVKVREFDTIVSPAHEEGFKEVFLGKNCWYAIRLSRPVREKAKYIAIYVTGPKREVSHYGRIASIKPYKKTGRYIVRLKGKPRRIGPLPWSKGVVIQSSRLALMADLKGAKSLGDVL